MGTFNGFLRHLPLSKQYGQERLCIYNKVLKSLDSHSYSLTIRFKLSEGLNVRVFE